MSLSGGLPTRIGLGTAPISSHRTAPHWWGPQDRETAVRAVRAAVDAGVGWIDTAPMYGWGRAEEIVAEALAGLPERPLVLTKCGTLRADDGSFYTDNSPSAIRADVDGSLRRLGVDRLDLVQVHDEDPAVPVEETWGALHGLVDEGLIGAAGLSNHAVELLDRALAIGPVATVQNQYSLRRPVARVRRHVGVVRAPRRDVSVVGIASAPASWPTSSSSPSSTPTTCVTGCGGPAPTRR